MLKVLKHSSNSGFYSCLKYITLKKLLEPESINSYCFLWIKACHLCKMYMCTLVLQFLNLHKCLLNWSYNEY